MTPVNISCSSFATSFKQTSRAYTAHVSFSKVYKKTQDDKNVHKRIAAAAADLVSMLKLNQRVGIVVSWEIHLQEGPVIYI
jgi:hypothetical protein